MISGNYKEGFRGLYIYCVQRMVIVLWSNDAAEVEDRRAGRGAPHYCMPVEPGGPQVYITKLNAQYRNPLPFDLLT